MFAIYLLSERSERKKDIWQMYNHGNQGQWSCIYIPKNLHIAYELLNHSFLYEKLKVEKSIF